MKATGGGTFSPEGPVRDGTVQASVTGYNKHGSKVYSMAAKMVAPASESTVGG